MQRVNLKKHKILFLSILFFSSGYITNILLESDKLVLNSIAEQLSVNQIENFLKIQEKWQLASFLLLPVIFYIKASIISSILYVGVFFFSKTKVNFKQLLNVSIKAEFVFLGVGVLKLIWFYFFQTNYTLEDLQYFYPLSALNIIGYNGLETYFIYPFQVLNLFELAYILLLGYYIGKLVYTPQNKENPMDFGLKIVASSYVPALFLWVTVVMFFTLNYS